MNLPRIYAPGEPAELRELLWTAGASGRLALELLEKLHLDAAPDGQRDARVKRGRHDVEDTLGAVVKDRDDLELVRDNLQEIVAGA